MSSLDRWNARAPRVLYLGSAPTLGDGAIGDGLLRRMRTAWPGADLQILTSTPGFYARLPSASGARLGPKPELTVEGPARLPWGLDLHARTAWRLSALARDRIDLPGVLPAAAREAWRDSYGWADVVLHQGGPQWNDRWLPAGSLRFHALRLAAGRGRGRPLALLGQGCGPFRWQGGWRAAARRRGLRGILSRCTAVVARDAGCAEALAALGLRRTAVWAASDPALLLEPEESPENRPLLEFLRSRRRPVLALSLRGLRPEYPELLLLEPAFRRRMAAFLDAAALRFELIFLSTGGAEDREALAAVEALRQGPPVGVPGEGDLARLPGAGLGPAELAAVYGACHLLLAVRLHPAILAATAGVPTLLVPYDAKGERFARQAGLERFALPLARFTAEEAERRLDDLDRRREAVAHALHRRVAELRAATGEALDGAFARLEATARQELGPGASE